MSVAYLGIDLGTSAVKVVAIDETGRSLVEATRAYPMHHPFSGAAEAEPSEWWNATRQAVHELFDTRADLELDGIGVDGQMHGLVLTDEHGQPLRPAITWADLRAEQQTERWRRLPDTARAALANPITPGMTGPLLAWLTEHEPHHVSRAAAALLPKDWLRLQLTGRTFTEPSDASATLLWDAIDDTWGSALVSTLNLPTRLLPPVIPSAQPAGELTPAAAAQLGIPAAGVPVAAGAADTAATLYAVGVQPGQTLLTIGSGGQIVQPLTHPYASPAPVTHLYRAAEPARWYAMAAIQNAGLALNWARELLHASWDELYTAAQRPPKPTAPIFLPYLTGERTPLLNSRIRATWARLDLHHTRADLLQAASTGICCALRHAMASLPDPAPAELLLAGGGTRHPAMRRLLANTLQCALTPTSTRNASATGAALLAAAASGTPIPRNPAGLEPSIKPDQAAEPFNATFDAYLHAAEGATALANTVIP